MGPELVLLLGMENSNVNLSKLFLFFKNEYLTTLVEMNGNANVVPAFDYIFEHIPRTALALQDNWLSLHIESKLPLIA